MTINFLERTLVQRLMKKASQSNSNFHVSAVAFSKNGNLLGYKCNSCNFNYPASRRGAGIHAEASLIKKFGKQIDKIYILRVGRGTNILPIDACENCSKIANNMGIKIISLHKIIGYTPTEAYP